MKNRRLAVSITLLLLLSSINLNAKEISLTPEQANFVAMKVWQNEGAGLDKYLVHWNDGEDFASVGIGHFIWFSKGHTENFKEMFPEVIKFMETKSVPMPSWLNSSSPLPWNSKDEFYKAKNSQSRQYLELFKFLQSTKGLQAEFLAVRLNKALPKILNTLSSPSDKALVTERFNQILFNSDNSINEKGLYVLLDYINFKGEGIVLSERYNGEGWGLLQVLLHMDFNQPDHLKAFADSADARLKLRIKNSPPERGENRWVENWHNRVMGYAQ